MGDLWHYTLSNLILAWEDCQDLRPFSSVLIVQMIGKSQQDSTSNAPQRQAFQRLGSYLVEAGLITPAQVDVALNDQRVMEDMRFGEVLVARGWIKQQTLDFLMRKVVGPEQRAAKQRSQGTPAQAKPVDQVTAKKPPTPQEAPATPSVPAEANSLAVDVPVRQPYRSAAVMAKLKAAGSAAEMPNNRKALPSVPNDEDGVNWVG
ncbi:hypothetical protein ACN4EG_22040 [Alkalinema pantanalense CENA528]|uniref:hypothetical protein n=1 Tax=Alkalinema pantanalense TaxID=1620705 RepID=UPI003D6FAFF0